MRYPSGRFYSLPSREPPRNPFTSSRALSRHSGRFLLRGQVKKGGQRWSVGKPSECFPLRDKKYLRLRSGAIKFLERHDAIRSAKIDADAEFRAQFYLKPTGCRALLSAHLKLDPPAAVRSGVLHPKFEVSKLSNDRIDDNRNWLALGEFLNRGQSHLDPGGFL